MPEAGRGDAPARGVTLIAVPYHLGRSDADMALGPDAYLAGGLAHALESLGHGVQLLRVMRPARFKDTPTAVADINAKLAEATAYVLRNGRLPLIAGGNCNVALGAVAGLQIAGPAPAGIVWFDAHGDFNTPETSPGGFFDGMPLAILTGRCHTEVSARVARGHKATVQATADELVVHAGGRDFDPGEAAAFAASQVTRVSSGELLERGAEALAAPLAKLAERAAVLYLHIDMDVLDPAVAPAVDFPVQGGLSLDGLVAALECVAAATPVGVVSVTAYNPELDDEPHTTRAVGTRLMCGVVGALDRGGSR
jgi:arginase